MYFYGLDSNLEIFIQMILSHKHKFIFLKTKKTAGTSIEIALSKICGEKDILTPISEIDEEFRKKFSGISAQNYLIPDEFYSKQDEIRLKIHGKKPMFFNHITAEKIKSHIPENVWNEYFKFTIERNPFDKMVSLYFWRNGPEKFGDFYSFLTKGGLKGFTAYDIYSIDGVLAVDHVFKYEEIKSFGLDFAKKINLDSELILPDYRAKSQTRKIKDYKEILDERSIRLIEIIFARELKLFNYKF